MWILLYADDISLACDTAEKLREAVNTMNAIFLRWGLTISTKKTKVLIVGRMLQLKLQIQSSRYVGTNQKWCPTISTWAVFSPLTAPQTLRPYTA